MKTFSVSLLAIGMLFAPMAKLGSAAPLQPNDPSIAGNLHLWLAADQLGGLNTPGTPGAVSQWTDLSTNNNHATQGTANLMPSLVNGVFGINAMPVVRFNETGTTWDYLDMPNFMNSPNVTAFVVGRAATAPKQGDFQAFFSDYGSSGGVSTARLFIVQAFGTTTSTTGLRQIIRDGSSNMIGTSVLSGSDTSQEFIAMARLDAPADTLTRRQMFADGTFVQDFPANNSYDSTNTWETSHSPRLGWLSGNGGGALDGDIAEVIVFGAALTAEQYAGVEAYLYNKYFVIPEPGTGIMLLLAGVALALFRRRRSR